MIFLSKSCLYIPKCNGNEKLPDKEQVKFDVHALTGEEEEKFTLMFSSMTEDGKQKLVIEPKAVAMFKSQVDRVYGVYKDAKGKEAVTDAADFVGLPNTYEYITETVAFIRNGMTEQELKN